MGSCLYNGRKKKFKSHIITEEGGQTWTGGGSI